MIQLSTQSTFPPYRRAWEHGICVGRAYELLRADVQEHLAQVCAAVPFKSCRFHGLFHDDMQVVIRHSDGSLRFQWGHVGKVFDAMLRLGLKPFVELNPMPRALASGDQTFFYWRKNVTPPKDHGEWSLLVESFARWAIARYGSEEVRSWRFEVWNEANLDAFWTGGWDGYLKLFDASREGLHRVDPSLHVGGPASAEGGWLPDFVHARPEADFISTHVYPMNEFASVQRRTESPYAPGAYVRERLKRLRELVGDRPFFLTEWNALDARSAEEVDWLDNPTIDGISSAATTVRVALDTDSVMDGLFWWVASDVFEEAGMPQSPFSGTYGLLTVDGLPKPSFHAFRFLRRLQGERLAVPTLDLGRGVAATTDGELVTALAWNHVPPDQTWGDWSDSLRLSDRTGAVSVTRMQVKPGSGSALEVWERLGRPQNPTPVQLDCLRAASAPETEAWQGQADEPVPFTLGPNEIALIEWAPPPQPQIFKDSLSAESAAWNAGLTDVPSDPAITGV